MDLWDFVIQHLVEILSVAIFLFGLIKLLGHLSTHRPESGKRQQHWQGAYEAANAKGNWRSTISKPVMATFSRGGHYDFSRALSGAILTLEWVAWHYRLRLFQVSRELKMANLSENEKSKTLAAQCEENARDKQTIVLLRAEIESVRNYAFALYVELQETGRDAAKFRFLFRFFEKEASALASRVDGLSAARLAAEKKELGARLVEFLLGCFFVA
jgi:hypothetical protein